MNFQIISDLHGRINRLEINKKADILLLAGDSSENIDVTFKILKSSPIPVLFIPGNHEFYHKDYYDTYMRLKDFCDRSNGDIIFADNETIEIDDYQIISSTLWSDFSNLDPYLVEASWGVINDYRKINIKEQDICMSDEILKLHNIHLENLKKIILGEDELSKNIFYKHLERRMQTFNNYDNYDELNEDKFTPYHSYILNKKNKLWLEKELKKDFNGKRIVMTHHAPSHTPLILGKYAVNPFLLQNERFLRKEKIHKIGAYCNSLESIMLQSNVDTWVHGHFHEPFNYRLGSANVICNATGNNKKEDMSFRNYIFNCSENEKNIALKNQLTHFKSNLKEIYNFLTYLSQESSLDYKQLVAIWREVEIILNNINSLPYTEINKNFLHYYPEPFLNLKNIDTNRQLYLKTVKTLLRESEFMFFSIEEWLRDL